MQTQKSAINFEIILFGTNQTAGITTDFKILVSVTVVVADKLEVIENIFISDYQRIVLVQCKKTPNLSSLM